MSIKLQAPSYKHLNGLSMIQHFKCWAIAERTALSVSYCYSITSSQHVCTSVSFVLFNLTHVPRFFARSPCLASLPVPPSTVHRQENWSLPVIASAKGNYKLLSHWHHLVLALFVPYFPEEKDMKTFESNAQRFETVYFSIPNTFPIA